MCVTVTSRFTVSTILVVKERRVVVISLLDLHSDITSVDILIRHRMESTPTMPVGAFTFALMARREDGRAVRKL